MASKFINLIFVLFRKIAILLIRFSGLFSTRKRRGETSFEGCILIPDYLIPEIK